MESALPSPSKWRVRRTIARKEIVTIAGHKNYLAPLLIPILLSLLFRLLFGALNADEGVVLLVVDPGNSALAAVLEQAPEVEVRRMAGEAEMLAELAGDATGGVVIPVDFDTAVTANQQPPLTILLNSEARESNKAILQKLVSEQLWISQYDTPPARLSWQEYQTGSAAFAAYSVDNYLYFLLVLLSITTVGVVILPQMMLEEKEGGVLAALLASPADYADLLLGKVAAAFIYALILAGVITVLNQGYTGNWWLTAVATLLVIIFSLAVGVLFGLWAETKGQCHAYSAIFVLLLNMPSWFSVVPFANLSPILQAVLRLIPTYYYIDTLIQSLNGLVDPAQAGFNLAVLLVSGVITWGIVSWRLRRVAVVSI